MSFVETYNESVCLKYSILFCSQFIVDMLENIPAKRLNQSKMNCIKDMIDSKLFCIPECRGIMLPQFCQQIREKLENKEEVSAMKNVSPRRIEMWQIRICKKSSHYNVKFTQMNDTIYKPNEHENLTKNDSNVSFLTVYFCHEITAFCVLLFY